MTNSIRVAVDWLRAPVTAKRTTAARDHVEREEAMLRPPGLPILINIHQVPSRKGESVEISHQIAATRVLNVTGLVPESQTGNRMHRCARNQLEQCGLSFPQQDVVKSGPQVVAHVIRSVWPV